jgi:hypothetical protein
MAAPSRIHVGGFDYELDFHDKDQGEVFREILDGLGAADGKVIEVPVLDEGRRPMMLYLDPRNVDALVLDRGFPARPGEISTPKP